MVIDKVAKLKFPTKSFYPQRKRGARKTPRATYIFCTRIDNDYYIINGGEILLFFSLISKAFLRIKYFVNITLAIFNERRR